MSSVLNEVGLHVKVDLGDLPPKPNHSPEKADNHRKKSSGEGADRDHKKPSGGRIHRERKKSSGDNSRHPHR